MLCACVYVYTVYGLSAWNETDDDDDDNFKKSGVSSVLVGTEEPLSQCYRFFVVPRTQVDCVPFSSEVGSSD